MERFYMDSGYSLLGSNLKSSEEEYYNSSILNGHMPSQNEYQSSGNLTHAQNQDSTNLSSNDVRKMSNYVNGYPEYTDKSEPELERQMDLLSLNKSQHSPNIGNFSQKENPLNSNYQNNYRTSAPINMNGTSEDCFFNILGSVDPPNLKLCDYYYDHPDSVKGTNHSMSSTLTHVPPTCKQLKNIRLPFGVMTTPLYSDQPIPLLEPNSVVRCSRCSSYMNPYITVSAFNSFVCNMCGQKNTLSENGLFDGLMKKKVLLNQKTEVNYPFIEYAAPACFSKDAPTQMSYIFLIDISDPRMIPLYITDFCSILKNNFHHLEGDKRATLSVILFDQFLHVFCCKNPSLAAPIDHLIVTDIEDPFLPSKEESLFKFKADTNIVEALFESIPKMIQGSSEKSASCVGSALTFAFNLLKKTGGRVTTFLSSPPNAGLGSYVAKPNPNWSEGNESVTSVFISSTDFYKQMGMEAVSKKVSFDFFSSDLNNIGIANFAHLSQFTGGNLYSSGSPDKVSMRELFKRNFKEYLSMKIGSNAIIRFRFSKGIVSETYFGNFFIQSCDKLLVPVITQHAGVAVQLTYDDDPYIHNRNIYVQMSVIYSKPSGERILRVHTLAIATMDMTEKVYSNLNPITAICFISRMAVERVLISSIVQTRESLINSFADLCLSVLRCKGTKPVSNCLILPLPVVHLGMMVHSLLKSPLLNPANNDTVDSKFIYMADLRHLSHTHTYHKLVTTVYSVSDILSAVVHHSVNPKDLLTHLRGLPPYLSQMTHDGVYLLNRMTEVVVYVRRDAHPLLLKNLFDVSDFSILSNTNINELQTSENQNATIIRDFIESLSIESTHNSTCFIAKEGDIEAMSKITKLLPLDKTSEGSSFKEFALRVAQIMMKEDS